MYSNHIEKMLENALDSDISEFDFWHMTLAELDRLVESKNRRLKTQAREKATYDYILAALVGRALSISENASFPEIYEVYPSLFGEQQEVREEQKQEQKDELSALRFKQFARSYNKKYEEVANDK